MYAGKFLYWSYHSDEKLNLLNVYFHQVLFSYKKGWFVFTPFMILSIAGFVALYRQYKNLFWCCLVVSFIAIYLVMCWSNWNYGGSFSMRAVVQYYALLIFPLASLIHYAIKRWFSAVPFYIFLLFCTWLNLVMTYQANCTGIMESDNMTEAYYWRIFGKLQINPNDKKLIYTDEEMPEGMTSRLTTIASKNFSADSGSAEFKGEKGFVFDSTREFLPELVIGIDNSKTTWYRGYCEVYFDQWEGDSWKQPNLYVWLANSEGKKVKNNSYKIQRIITPQHWDTIFIDIKAPANNNYSKLHLGIFTSRSNARVFVRGMHIDKAVE